jgi:TM2 domain-containing membrane protein YozV
MREFGFQEAAPAVRYCADCGKQIHPRAEICPNCGVRQHSARATERYRYTPNRIIAGLLAILLVGGFGAHKFYMGQAGKGLLYLFTSWLFFPFIIAFLEGIRYLLMSDEDFEEQYWH